MEQKKQKKQLGKKQKQYKEKIKINIDKIHMEM